MAPWNTSEISVQRRSRMPRSVRFCRCTTPLAVCRSTVPEICRRPGASSFRIASAVVVLPQPDSPARPSASPRCSSKETPETISTSPSSPRVADVQVVDGQDGIAHRRRACGLESSSTTWPTAKNASTKSVIASARGYDVPPRALVDRTRLEAVVEHRAPGERVRVAEAEVREARLAQHRERDDQHRVGPHDRHHVGQDVASHDPEVRGPLRAGALHELALAQRQHLRAHDARRPRPAGDREHDHDDARAAAGDLLGVVLEAAPR